MILWRCRDRELHIGIRPLIMGIVNVTPDSFSDGGQFDTVGKAVEHGLKLVADGADILDLGGESSRPGAAPVSLEEEERRVIPVVAELARQCSVPISVDTYKSEVARKAVDAGACIINDITALQGDLAMAEVARGTGAGVVLMHMLGNPQTMQANPIAADAVGLVATYLDERIAFAVANGIGEACLAVDPGIGFGKTVEQTWEQLRHLADYRRFGRPICLGVSRKGFIGTVTGRPRQERVVGSVAVACHAILQGAVQILRVHDVAEHRDAVLVLEQLQTPSTRHAEQW